MAADVDHVVHAPGDPVVAILITAAAVAGEVGAGIGAEVGVDETLVVAIHGTHLARPGIQQHQVAFGRAFDEGAIGIHQGRLHAEERQAGRTGLEVGGTGQRADEDAAGFGLPPGIDHRTACVADHVVIPAPGFGIDRLADAAQQTQRLARGAFHRCLAFTHQGADGGGRGVEDGDLVLVDDVPEPRHVGIVGDAFEHHRGRAVGQRTIDDVTVAGDPAHVGRAPVDVVLAQVEHSFVRIRGEQQVAAGGVQHALGLAGGTGGVEDEQRIFRVHRFGRAFGRLRIHHRIEPAITRHLHVHGAAGVAHDEDRFDRVGTRQFQRSVHVGFQWHFLATAQAFVGGDDELGAAVGHAIGD